MHVPSQKKDKEVGNYTHNNASFTGKNSNKEMHDEFNNHLLQMRCFEIEIFNVRYRISKRILYIILSKLISWKSSEFRAAKRPFERYSYLYATIMKSLQIVVNR